MPTLDEVRQSPPSVRRDLLEQADRSELAQMIEEQVGIELTVYESAHTFYLPVGEARDLLERELDGEGL